MHGAAATARITSRPSTCRCSAHERLERFFAAFDQRDDVVDAAAVAPDDVARRRGRRDHI